MSRTIRRKNRKPNYIYKDPWNKGYIKVGSKEHKKLIHEFHSDKDWGWSPPKWFRKMYIKPFRQEVRMKVHRYLQNSEYMELVLPLKERDARWDWF